MTDEQIKEPQQEGQQVEAPEEGLPTLKEVLIEQAIEGEAPASAKFTLKKVLGGDILSTKTIRDQIWVFMLIAVFMIGYIANRYKIQKNLLEIDHLNTMLQDAKYKALSSSSQLTEKSRESHVLDMLKNNKDSVLKIPSQPPYIVNVPEK